MADSPLQVSQDEEKSCNYSPSPELPRVSNGNNQAMPVNSKVRRRVDLHILPLVTLLYLCSFLDRANIGNAKIAGMSTDLHLTGMKYQLCAAIFFIPYSILEIPCNVVLKIIRPSIWLSSLMVAWGIVMLSMAFVTSFHGLLIARFFLGVTEAGLGPGIAFYITLWYRRADQARPLSIFFSAATIAGVFGGFLAFAIEKMDGKGGLHGWAWIFLLEGLATILCALLALWKLPDYPRTATFLADTDKNHLIEVLKRDTADEPSHFEMKFVWQTLRDPLSWLQTMIYIGTAVPIYAISLFLPTIVNDLGFSPSNAQLLTIPPYALGCLCTVGIGLLSDRLRKRGPFVMGCCAFAIIGFSMLYAADPAKDPGVGYAGTIFAACGVFPTIPVLLAWCAGNAGASLKKGVIIALVGAFANIGGVCSSFIYRTQDSPRFHLGHGIVIGFLCMSFLGSAFATYWYKRLNEAKEEWCTMANIDRDQKAEYAHLGCHSPLFRYSL